MCLILSRLPVFVMKEIVELQMDLVAIFRSPRSTSYSRKSQLFYYFSFAS